MIGQLIFTFACIKGTNMIPDLTKKIHIGFFLDAV